MPEKITLTEQQHQAVYDSGGALLVSAAAGSGKTRVLVERLMRHITDEKSPKNIDEFLVITFTKAAAAELRARVHAAIAERVAEEPMNRRLRRQADMCHKAHIGTIHSFCVDILRENAHLLDVPPDFRVADESESEMIRREVLEDVLEASYDAADLGSGFYRLIDTMAAGRDDRKIAELVLELYSKLRSHPYPDKWAEERLEMFNIDGLSDAAQTVWGRMLLEEAQQSVRYWARRLDRVMLIGDEAFSASYGPSISASIDSAEAFCRAETWDEAVEKADIQFPRPKNIKGYDELKEERNRCKAEMLKTVKLFDTKSAEIFEDMRESAPVITELFALTDRFSEAYAAEKKRRGVIDFSDQEHMAVSLLVDRETGMPTELAHEISQRFHEVMIDEYQDVNAVQELIFSAVSRGGRNLFMVGDVKQSIYRFRLADPTIFLGKYRSFGECGEADEGEPRRVLLQSNFRSRAGVLEAVNFIFENVMSERFGEMEYTEREKLYAGAEYPESLEPCAELDIIDLSESDEDSSERLEAEAEFVAHRIERIIAETLVSDGSGGMRKAKYGDIAILLRSMKGKSEVFAGALKEHGIPVALDSAERFLDAPEVTMLLSVLAVIDNPRQDIPLISAMRSPIWGFSADELARIRLSKRGGDIWSAVLNSAEADAKCLEFTEDIKRFRDKVPDVGAAELIWLICIETGFFGIASAMRGGNAAERNIMQLIDIARRFENTGYRGLYAFLEYIHVLTERGDDISAAAADDRDAVKILSIHKSKGLEFPIVVLADLSKKINMRDTSAPLLIHPTLGVGAEVTDTVRRIKYPSLPRLAIMRKMEKETYAEELRVLYVAMTRAREKLIMTVSYTDASRELQKLGGMVSGRLEPEILNGTRRMCDWILLPLMLRPGFESLQVGETAECTDGEWLVSFIGADEPHGGGCAEKNETAESVPADAAVMNEIAENLSFVYSHSAAETIPSKLTATELKSRAKELEAAEEAERIGTGHETMFRTPDFSMGHRLTASERGTAAHVAMQHVDFEKCRTLDGVVSELERLKTARLLTDEQMDAVDPQKLLSFFTSDIGRRVFEADRIYREFKFSLLVPAHELIGGECLDEVLLQGVTDCCIEKDGALTIIDYKTDYVTDETVEKRAAEYARQLEVYALAMERVTGKPVKDRALWFFSVEKAVFI